MVEESRVLKLLSKADVAEALGVTVRTIDRFISTHRIECIKVGRSVRFRPESVESFLKAATVPVAKGAKP